MHLEQRPHELPGLAKAGLENLVPSRALWAGQGGRTWVAFFAVTEGPEGAEYSELPISGFH